MARIRTIKPDAFTSDSLSSVPRGTRWTFAGLWTYADDAGRGRDDARLIKAALYPIDDDTTLHDVADDLNMLHRIGAICRYEVGGRGYLHMPKWGHQRINRPTPAKSPPCPSHEGGTSGELVPDDPYVTDHAPLTESSLSPQGGKGRERKGMEGISCAPADADGAKGDESFEAFWDAYDKKKDRKRAEQKYRLALKKRGVTPDLLLTAATAYVKSQRAKGKHPEYTKNADAWLNGECWNDEPEQAPIAKRPPHVSQLHASPPPGLSPEESDQWAWGQHPLQLKGQ